MESPALSTHPTHPTHSTLTVCLANYTDPIHAQAVVDLLDAYAQDPAGGSKALPAFVKTNLVKELAARPQTFSVLAFDSGVPVGLVNCIEGFSTFACKPLINVHDVVVIGSHRGQRVGEQMLALVEQIAVQRGACKITMEVLSGNLSAMKLYNRIGFGSYQLDPAKFDQWGSAQFLQKWLA